MPTVLIVDDHPSFRATARALLEDEGFEVITRLSRNGGGPRVVLVSSRDGADFGPLVERSGAAGFIPKADLCASAISALLS